jgi:DNA-binding NarL/FixJ family response regulator
VFLVEDAPLLRERLEALIAAIPGASVVGHASGAQEAVSGILAARLDVLRGLRAAHFAPRVYVLTNYPLEGYRQAAERLGARGFFDKSHDFHLLRDEIGKVLP